jgi:hypothetical protein
MIVIACYGGTEITADPLYRTVQVLVVALIFPTDTSFRHRAGLIVTYT